jgi:DNA-binding MarR family transcriptional regulator
MAGSSPARTPSLAAAGSHPIRSRAKQRTLRAELPSEPSPRRLQSNKSWPPHRSHVAATLAGGRVLRLDDCHKGVYALIMEPVNVDFPATRQCVCTAARRRSRDLTRAFEKAMRGSGIRGTQFTLLATLVQTGPIPTTRLADFQGLERTTLTRNLGLLVRDGFVRIDEGEDRRVRKVAITPAGEEAARRAFPFWKKAQDAALAATAGLGGAQG